MRATCTDKSRETVNIWLPTLEAALYLTPIRFSLTSLVSAKTLCYHPHPPLESFVDCRNPEGLDTLHDVKTTFSCNTKSVRIQHSGFTSIVNVLPLPV